MQYLQFTAARADTGAVLPLATGTVKIAGTATLATLYNATGGSIGNPVTASAAGLVGFAAPDGFYDITVVSADSLYTSPTILKQQFFDYSGPAAVAAIGYTSPLSGAATRTTAAKLAEQTSIYDVLTTGIDPTGTTDSSAAFQAAYNALAAAGGGTLWIPPGTYIVGLNLTSRKVALRGMSGASNDAYSGASTLKPVNATTPVMRIKWGAGGSAWDQVPFRDMHFVGLGTQTAPLGRAIVWGNDTYVTGDELNISVLIDHCSFNQFDKCVQRQYGNIGLEIRDSTFEASNFHVWSRGYYASATQLMHVGCLRIQNNHLRAAYLASIYIDGNNVQGSGQIIISYNRIENNRGFVIFAKNIVGIGVAGIIIDDMWNEGNGLDYYGGGSPTTVTIDSTVYNVRCARFENVPNIEVRNTPIGTVELIHSSVATSKCDLNALMSSNYTISSAIDARSSMVHQDVLLPLGSGLATGRPIPGTIQGICRVVNTGGGGDYAVWMTMEPRCTLTGAAGSAKLASVNGSATIMTGDTTAVGNTLPGLNACRQYVTTASTNAPVFCSGAAGAGIYYVAIFTYQLVSGTAPTLQVTGSAGVTEVRPLASSAWETIVAVTYCPSAFTLYFQITGGAAAGTINIGGAAGLAFSTEQGARDYINAGMFPL